MKLKISTLFHWLYATLMFLPILMFFPSCLYYGFNEHAENETTTQINYKYQTNEVNDPETDLINGNTYYFHIDFNYSNSNSNMLNLFNNLEDSVYFEIINIKGSLVPNINSGTNYINSLSFRPNWNSTALELFTTKDIENDIMYQLLSSGTLNYDDRSGYIEFICTYQNYYSSSIFDDYINVNKLPDTLNVIGSVSENVENTITQSVSNAWQRTWDLPLFSWTQNSFVAAPFSYITGLFGLSSDNSINYVFTYFVSISICWLVFDLIMYVPNLAHRWLDRSAIE